jgi:predicted RNase H-like HicB family nuclease
MAEHFTYRVSWADEDKEYVGTCAEFPSLSHLDPSPDAAMKGIRELVEDVVADMRKSGEPIPQSIADRSFSGKFLTRVAPELHRRLTIEAAEMHISFNRLVNSRLATPVAERVANWRFPDGPAKKAPRKARGKAQSKPRVHA